MRITFCVSTGYLSEKDETLATATSEASLKATQQQKQQQCKRGKHEILQSAVA